MRQIRSLLERPVSSSTIDVSELFNEACLAGEHEVVGFLLEQGCDPKLFMEKHPAGFSGLHLAINCKDAEKGLKTAKVLLEADPTLVHQHSKIRNIPPLNEAASGLLKMDAEKYFEMVRLLLQNGADVNAKDMDDQTPLHKAAEGMNINRQNSGWHPLPPNWNMIEILVNAGGNLMAANKEGKTPIHIMLSCDSCWFLANKQHLSEISGISIENFSFEALAPRWDAKLKAYVYK